MGLKKIGLICCILCVAVLLGSCHLLDARWGSQKYTDRLLKRLKSDEVFQVRDIFDFEFDRAYVMKDNYISGADFAEEYDLDISIDEVGKTSAEIQRRIVFVDAEGKYVFEYQYSAETLFAKEEGFVIYPETKMRRTEQPLYWDIVTFEFLEIKPTDYYGYPYSEDINKSLTEKLISLFETDEVFQVSDVFSFEFDCAYVFKDSYISGETFTEKYNLDLSINEVEKTSSKDQKRIVFVDKEGKFIFCYQYLSTEIISTNEGFIIYPDTQIKRTETPLYWDTVSFEFLNIPSSDFYG